MSALVEFLSALTLLASPIAPALGIAYTVWVVSAIASCFGTPDPLTDDKPWREP